MINTIFFDIDDTLLNSKIAELNATRKFKEINNCFANINDEEFAKAWRNIAEEIYEKYLKKEISFDEQRIRRIQKIYEMYGLEISKDLAREKFKDYSKVYEENWILFEDTIEVLNKLKDRYKFGIISNGDGKQQKNKLEKTGITRYFSQIIISGDVGASKPDKRIFEIAYEKMNVQPKDSLMIGDKYQTDIQGAINAGLNAIWVNRKNENIQFENTIKELKELEKIIEEKFKAK